MTDSRTTSSWRRWNLRDVNAEVEAGDGRRGDPLLTLLVLTHRVAVDRFDDPLAWHVAGQSRQEVRRRRSPRHSGHAHAPACRRVVRVGDRRAEPQSRAVRLFDADLRYLAARSVERDLHDLPQ